MIRLLLGALAAIGFPGFLAGGLFFLALRERRERLDAQLLAYLAEHGESYALQMVRGGVGRRGTLYIHLARLEDWGLISSRREDASGCQLGQLPRSLYQLTEAGRAALVVELARFAPRERAS